MTAKQDESAMPDDEQLLRLVVRYCWLPALTGGHREAALARYRGVAGLAGRRPGEATH